MNTDLMTGLILAGIAVNFVGMLIIGIRVEVRGGRNDRLQESVDGLKERQGRLEGLQGRVEVLEELRRGAVSHADISAIRDRMSELSGQLVGIASRVDASATMISTIQKHLMESE